MTTYGHNELSEKSWHHAAPTGGAWSRAEQHRQSLEGIAENALTTAAEAGLLKVKQYSRAKFALDNGRPADTLRIIDDALSRQEISAAELTDTEQELVHIARMSGNMGMVQSILRGVLQRRENAAFATTDTGRGKRPPLAQLDPREQAYGRGERTNKGRPDVAAKLRPGTTPRGPLATAQPNRPYRPPQYGVGAQIIPPGRAEMFR